LKHQRIDKPSPSKLPEYSTKPPGGLGEASSTPRAERKGKEGRGPDRKGGEGTRPERKESRETEIEATAPPTPRSFADARSANGGSPDPNNRLLSDEELMALPLEQRRAYCRKLAEMPTPPEVSQ
jgi:hypothetical protein